MKKVTKENRLVLILHLYDRKPLFSADAERYSKVVCLNVYVQGTIWIANANCEYFAITKVCCMQFVVCSRVAWNTRGSWGRIQIEAPKIFFLVCLFQNVFYAQFNVSHIKASYFNILMIVNGKKVGFEPIVHVYQFNLSNPNKGAGRTMPKLKLNVYIQDRGTKCI